MPTIISCPLLLKQFFHYSIYIHICPSHTLICSINCNQCNWKRALNMSLSYITPFTPNLEMKFNFFKFFLSISFLPSFFFPSFLSFLFSSFLSFLLLSFNKSLLSLIPDDLSRNSLPVWPHQLSRGCTFPLRVPMKLPLLRSRDNSIREDIIFSSASLTLDWCRSTRI